MPENMKRKRDVHPVTFPRYSGIRFSGGHLARMWWWRKRSWKTGRCRDDVSIRRDSPKVSPIANTTEQRAESGIKPSAVALFTPDL